MVSVPAVVRANLAKTLSVATFLMHFGVPQVAETFLIYIVSAPSDDQNQRFVKGLLANTAWSEVCEGSGALEPDSPGKSMAGGRGERPRAEKHGLESPCTWFGRFC